jgi:hypothetical protein
MLKNVKTRKLLAIPLLFGALLLLLASSALAQDEEDPPGRIARINFTEGSVSFQPAGEGDWLTAVPNRPITTGDNLWTDENSRDELHVGSTVLRMGPETSLTFLDLDDQATQLRLAEGTLIVRVRHVDDGDNYEIDAPNLAFDIQRPGTYRIDVSPNGDVTTVTAWQGRGEVIGGGYSYDVLAGQRAVFSGTDELNHDIEALGGRDGFDSWAFDRDDREDHLNAQNYVSEEMTGYEDLDGYGRWNYVAGYGNVWVPTGVPGGWAPYRFGHWAYIAPWGWTWVEDEPWGFAPFHYGRWASGPAGWFWVPGPVVVRPVYAPALVAFVGGAGFAIGGGPAVGWFPLAPGEVFVPGYRVSPRYVTQINITNTVVNVTRVNNVYNTYVNHPNDARFTYANQRVNNGVTVVDRETFVNARPVYRNLTHVDERQIAAAPVSHESIPQPVRPSVLGSGAPAKAHPPAAILTRQVVASRAPAPPKAAFASRPLPPTKVETAARPAPQQPERPAAVPEQQQEQSHNASRPPSNNRQIQAYQQERTAQEPAPQPQRPVQPEEAHTAAPPPASERNVPRPPENNEREPQQQWSHPLAKPAPPQQAPSPQHQQQEEQKYQKWQAQQKPAEPPKQSAHPEPARPAPPPQNEKEKH